MLMERDTDRISDSWMTGIQNELKRIDDLLVQSRKLRRRIRKDFVHQRDSSLFLGTPKCFVYQRDNCRCFANCPPKLKPKFDDQKTTWHIWEVLSGTSVQTDRPSIPAPNVDFGDIYQCHLIRTKASFRARLWFSRSEVALDLPEEGRTHFIKLREIWHVFPRHYLQQPTAIEIFVRSGESYFLDFSPTQNNDILGLFAGCDLVKLDLVELTKQWVTSSVKLRIFDASQHVRRSLVRRPHPVAVPP
jgi:hypothetical protein